MEKDMSVWIDVATWGVNLLTGLILLGVGYALFTLKVRHIDKRKRERLRQALYTEINLLRPVSVDDIQNWKEKIQEEKLNWNKRSII